MSRDFQHDEIAPARPLSPGDAQGSVAPTAARSTGEGRASGGASLTDFFAEKEISEEVGYGRPYTVHVSAEQTRSFYPLNKLTPNQVADLSKMVNHMDRFGGTVIHRVPAPGWPPITPELKPPKDKPFLGRKTVHYHGPPTDEPLFNPESGKRLHPSQIQSPDDKAEEHIKGKLHEGINSDEVHVHVEEQKYKFLATPLIEKAFRHSHRLMYDKAPDQLAAHLLKQHADGRVPGIDTEHEHWVMVKDRDEKVASRLDIHPLALPMFRTAEIVWLGAEGCPKADSMLTFILKTGLAATVCSVPSVGSWLTPELQDEHFIESYFRGRTTRIVMDADGVINPKVTNLMLLFRQFLRRQNVDAHIYAPPPPPGGWDSIEGKYKLNGADDYLASGGSLDDFVRFEREVPAGALEWVEEQAKARNWAWPRVLRARWNYEGLALFAGEDGTYYPALRTAARAMGEAPSYVERGVRDLIDLGAVAANRPLETKRDWFSKKLDWKDRPTITVRTDLRAESAPDSVEESYKTSVQVAQSLVGRKGGFQQKALEQKRREINEEGMQSKVLTLKKIKPEMSNREIGRRLDVDDKTVGKILKKREESRMKLLEEIATLKREHAEASEDMQTRLAGLEELAQDLEFNPDHLRDIVAQLAGELAGAEI